MFSRDGDGSLTFDDFLNMMSVLSETVSVLINIVSSSGRTSKVQTLCKRSDATSKRPLGTASDPGNTGRWGLPGGCTNTLCRTTVLEQRTGLQVPPHESRTQPLYLRTVRATDTTGLKTVALTHSIGVPYLTTDTSHHLKRVALSHCTRGTLPGFGYYLKKLYSSSVRT